MFRPCNRTIVRLFNRDHQIDYIIRGFLGGGRDLALHNFQYVIIHNSQHYVHRQPTHTEPLREDTTKFFCIHGHEKVPTTPHQNVENNSPRRRRSSHPSTQNTPTTHIVVLYVVHTLICSGYKITIDWQHISTKSLLLCVIIC